MRQLENVNSEPKQVFEIILDDNSIVEFSLEYIDTSQSWLYSLSWNGVTVNNRRLVASPNILNAFKNFIPFGLAIIGVDALDPSNLEDFESERFSIFILNEEDLQFVDDKIDGA